MGNQPVQINDGWIGFMVHYMHPWVYICVGMMHDAEHRLHSELCMFHAVKIHAPFIDFNRLVAHDFLDLLCLLSA